MKEIFKENSVNKVIWFFLFMNPFLDVATSFANHYLGHSLSIVLGLKFLFLVFLFFLCMKKIDKKLVGYLVMIGIYFGLFLGLQYGIKGSQYLLLEAQNLFRTFYLPLVFSFLMILSKRGILEIKRQYLILLLLLYLSFLVIPSLSGVGFNSYAHSKGGNIGWFYSTNEIGGILAILGPFLLLFLSKQKWWLGMLGMAFYFSGILVLGTKVPVLALGLMILCFLFHFFHKLWLKKDWKKMIISTFVAGFCTILLSLVVMQTSFYKNIQIHLDFLGIQQFQDLLTFHHIDHFVFSERLSFLKKTHEVYLATPKLMKVIGMGVGDMSLSRPESMKMIEMDYFDIFYHYGVIGFILFVLPIFLLNQKRKWQLDEKISIGLVLLLALFSGHILVSPSVSVLVSLVLIPKSEVKE